jgi:hypothetical protein
MPKNIEINPSHKFTSGRGETETVAEALAWVEKHMSGEDGESDGPAYTPGDLIVYAVRRLRALHKDGKRHASGKLATRLYAPRIDALKEGTKVPKLLVEAVANLDTVQAALHPEPKAPSKGPAKPKPTPKAAKPVKADGKASARPVAPSKPAPRAPTAGLARKLATGAQRAHKTDVAPAVP